MRKLPSVDGYNLQVQMAELEAKRKLQQSGGSKDLRKADESQEPMTYFVCHGQSTPTPAA